MNENHLINKYNSTKKWPEYDDLRQLNNYQIYLVLRHICKQEHRRAEDLLLLYELEGGLPNEVHVRLLKYTENITYNDEGDE